MITLTELKPNVFHLHYPAEKGEVRARYKIILSAGGSLFEQDSENGVSHLTEHVLANYYNGMDATALSKYCAANAIYRNASTGRVNMDVITSGHKNDSRELLDMTIKKALRAELNEETFNQQKKIVLSEIEKGTGDPSYKLKVYSNTKLFTPDSYMQKWVLGSVDLVKTFNFNQIQERYSNILQRSSLLLVSSGGILNKNEIEEILIENLPNKQKEIVPLQFHDPFRLNSFDILPIIHEHANEHAEIDFYIPFSQEFKQYGAEIIFQRIFFSGASGLLYDLLRNKLGIIYSLSSTGWTDENILHVSITTNKENIQKAIDSMKSILMDTSEKEIYEEIDIIKKVITKREELSRDELFGDINYSEDMLFIFDRLITIEDYVNIILSVKHEDVFNIQKRMIQNLSKMQIAISSRDTSVADLKLSL